jgi:glutaredoxin 3
MKAKIYIKPTCPFCVKAVALLKQREIKTEAFDISSNPKLRAEISDSVGGYNTVPMIFLDGEFVGGCSELQALEAQGKLR